MKLHVLIGLLAAALVFIPMTSAYAADKVSADEPPAISFGSADGASARQDASEGSTTSKPTPKSKFKKPRIGFQTTVKPEDMKSYHRPESGDVGAQ